MSIVLITGDREAVGPLVARLKQASLNVLINCPPGAEDVVVFCVGVGDGHPMTDDAVSVCHGIAIARWAVLVDDTSDAADDSLKESRMVGRDIVRWIEQRAGQSLRIPVLTQGQPDLPGRLGDLRRSPPQRAVFGGGDSPSEIRDSC